MSKEYILVAGTAAVPLIGISLIKRRAGALGSAPWAHAAPPSNSTAAPNATQADDRQNLLAAVHTHSVVASIPSLPRVGFRSGQQMIPPVRNHTTLQRRVKHLVAMAAYKNKQLSRNCDAPMPG